MRRECLIYYMTTPIPGNWTSIFRQPLSGSDVFPPLAAVLCPRPRGGLLLVGLWLCVGPEEGEKHLLCQQLHQLLHLLTHREEHLPSPAFTRSDRASDSVSGCAQIQIRINRR